MRRRASGMAFRAFSDAIWAFALVFAQKRCFCHFWMILVFSRFALVLLLWL